MVYDSDLDITWLADANYAATQYEQSCGEIGAKDGLMDFLQATKWADELSFGGYSDWRLPKSAQPDPNCENQTVVGSHGFNCTAGEIGHLFYGEVNHGLGGKAGHNITEAHNRDFRLFHNFPSLGVYWYSTDFPSLPFISRNFQTRNGFANAFSKSVLINAWAVRDGDVGTDARPGPVAKENRSWCRK
jgi:hypothetical protein